MKLEIYNIKYRNEIASLVQAFLPDVEIEVYEDYSDLEFKYVDVWLYPWERKKLLESKAVISEDKSIFITFNGEERQESKLDKKNFVKKRVYLAMKRYTGKDLPWGTLTGIRPTKLVSNLLYGNEYTKENNINISEKNDVELFENIEQETRKKLRRTYQISKEKIDLSIEVVKKEHELLEKVDYITGYSLYVNIPFCPSTCAYCSFTSYPINKYKDKIDEYLGAIKKEIKQVNKEMVGKKLQTIYIGGGTPTTLEADKLDELLTIIEENLDLSNLLEITVEAGRPDSITQEKIKIIKKHGVDRISINPQSMNDKTLKLIGRKHSHDDIIKAFEIARKENITNINMDIILGLPGEGKEEVEHTLGEIRKLGPESLTIHSLALKRAAKMNTDENLFSDYSFYNNSEIMGSAVSTAREMGMNPYYLYRQKNMKGNLENIGFAKYGKECLYNILIMEEKQTIMAVGAGASSKIVNSKTGEVIRKHNPKDVNQYLSRV